MSSFVYCAFGIIFKKSLTNGILWSFYPLFSSKSFIVLFCFVFFSATLQGMKKLSQSGIKPVPSASEAQSLNHWTTMEILKPLDY